MTSIRLDGVGKTFPGGIEAVKDVSLEIGAGEFMVLVGPSGCGKSTLLRLIAGLEAVTTGAIAIGDRAVTDVPPRDRDIAMVFQNYALYPHMTVRRNLGYGLRVRRTPKAVVEDRVEEVARMLGLADLLDRKPGALSGGQRQRVAMGRAIVREPAAFLMDEPLSNLDAKLRVGMRSELSRLHARLATTTVYVTHDQIEAMTLGQRVTVMRDGIVQQVGRPQHLYRHPANVFVGAFVGSPSMNLVRAVVSGPALEFGGLTLPLAADRRPVRDGPVLLGIRPTSLADAGSAPAHLPTIEAEAALTEELGATNQVLFWVDSPGIDVDGTGAVETESTRLLAEDERCLFTAVVDPALAPQPGERVRLAVRTGELSFFDHETGVTLLASDGVDGGRRAT